MASSTEPESTAVSIVQPESGALVHEDAIDGSPSIAAFASVNNFRAAQRMAQALSSSDIVPKQYRGSVANCLVAMELAARTGASIFMVMQNLYPDVNGRPAWASTFLIGSVNSCGRFSPMRYEIVGTDPEKADYRVRAFATDKASGDVLHGTWITWKMVEAEGWKARTGSKWKTMPAQMFLYRSASFWVRAYAPDISLGMYVADEAEDIPARGQQSTGAVTDLNKAIEARITPQLSTPETDAEREQRLAEDRALAAQEK